MEQKSLKVLLIGDVFGAPGVRYLETHLPSLIKKYKVDVVIAQSENVSGRKGLIPKDFNRLKKAGVNIFTLGNHFLAKLKILEIIQEPEVVAPANLPSYLGSVGSRVFKIKGFKIRVTSLLGIAFNSLSLPWEQTAAHNFFDVIDQIIVSKDSDEDFHIVDFHAETTSEKNVFGLYLDGKVDVFVGTHTHVQTNDARLLPKGTFYITDLGMVGPNNCAIGAGYQEVYEKIRYGGKKKFKVSDTSVQFNGVVVTLRTNAPTSFQVLNFQEGID